MDVLGNFAFVLVRPLQAGNVGSAARALKNMGLGDLRLVAPRAAADGRAAASMAVHAGDVLRNAQTPREPWRRARRLYARRRHHLPARPVSLWRGRIA